MAFPLPVSPPSPLALATLSADTGDAGVAVAGAGDLAPPPVAAPTLASTSELAAPAGGSATAAVAAAAAVATAVDTSSAAAFVRRIPSND